MKKKRTHFAPLFVIVHVSSTRYTPIKNLMSIFLSFLYFLSLSNSHSILFIFHSRHTSATHAHIRKQKEKNFYFSFPFFFFFRQYLSFVLSCSWAHNFLHFVARRYTADIFRLDFQDFSAFLELIYSVFSTFLTVF